MPKDSDIRQRFLFENANVRGEIVRLNSSWQQLLTTHPYPESVQTLLGELLTSTILLSATLEYRGNLIAQVQTNDDLPLMITECNSDNHFRGLAQYNDQALLSQSNDLIKKGTLALTISPENGDRYQGIIELGSGNITHAIEDYMRRSQQIETRIWLAVNNNTAAGILLQKLPNSNRDIELLSQNGEDLWHKFTTFTDTVKAEELQQLPFSSLINRLYPEDDVRLFDPLDVQFLCSCAHSKVSEMLRLLGQTELESILLEKGLISVNCEFCNKLYKFDKVDILELLATDISLNHSSTRH